MTKESYPLISFIFAFFVASLSYFISLSTATLALSVFILVFGLIFSYIIADKYQKSTAILLFNIVYCIYLLLALNHFLGYQANWGFFTQDYRDEYKFFLITEQNQFQSIVEIFKSSFIRREYLEYGGYVFYISFIASLALSLFDGNHLLLQFLGTSFFGILTSLVVYKILNIYVNNKKSFYYSIIFMLFSPLVYFSFTLLRDTHIAFFYILGVYLLLSDNRNFYKLLLLILINYVVIELRFEHGIFFTIFTLYYSLNIFKKNKVALLVIGSFAFATFIYILSSNIGSLLLDAERYADFTDASVTGVEDSFGKYIYKLPPIIKEIFIVLNSQIQPFPSWGPLLNSVNIYTSVENILVVLSAFFWYTLFFCIFVWGFILKKYKYLPSVIKVLGIICIAFLLGNTPNMTLRRIIGFYPFIFLVFIYFRENNITDSRYKRTVAYSTYTYVLLIIIYFFLKL